MGMVFVIQRLPVAAAFLFGGGSSGCFGPGGPRRFGDRLRFAFERPDEIFARFIVEELPPGLTGLLVAGIFAAAMSSLSSSINSLASASAYDFWAPARGVVRKRSPRHTPQRAKEPGRAG